MTVRIAPYRFAAKEIALLLGLYASLFLLMIEAAVAQSSLMAAQQRVALLTVEGATQLGLLVGERNDRVFVLTVRSDLVEEYPESIKVTLSNGATGTGRWSKNDINLEKARLMLLSIPKPIGFSMPPLAYFTRSSPGQSLILLRETVKKQISLKLTHREGTGLSLTYEGIFTIKQGDALIGAPIYHPDRGVEGMLDMQAPENLRAITVATLRDALRGDDAGLFGLTAYDQRTDEVDRQIVAIPPVVNQQSPALASKPQSPATPASSDSPVSASTPVARTITQSFRPDFYQGSMMVQVGVSFAYYYMGKPAEPAVTETSTPLSGHVSMSLNVSPLPHLTVHLSARWTKRQVVFAKDPAYGNFALTRFAAEGFEFPLGFDIHLPHNASNVFVQINGSVAKPIKAQYEYNLQNKEYNVPLRSNQNGWQKTVSGGLGIRNRMGCLLFAYHYGLDPFINDDEPSRTVPQVTPFKKQNIYFRYFSLELGFYF